MKKKLVSLKFVSVAENSSFVVLSVFEPLISAYI